MYEPQFWIDPKLYPYLTRWGLSMGYEVNTNKPHNTLLYGLSCIDPIKIRELNGMDAPASLNREEAVDLVEALEAIRTNSVTPTGKDGEMLVEGVGAYDPCYHPPIRLDEDMYAKYFLPYMTEAGYQVQAVHEGIFWEIMKVCRSDYDAANWKTDVGVLCRSEVTEMVRDLEYERRIPPYLVAYNLPKAGENITKTWLNDLDTMEKAVAVLEEQKPRHIPSADWRIYTDVTAIARQLKDDFPDEVVMPEGWLWLRIWHPGQYGADYWSGGTYDNLGDLRVAILDEEALDMYSVTAVYACVQHEAPPEPPAPERPPQWTHISSAETYEIQYVEETAEAGVALLWQAGKWNTVKIYCTSHRDLLEKPKFSDFEELDAASDKPVAAILRPPDEQKPDRLMVFAFHKAVMIDEKGVTYERYAESAEAEGAEQ